MKGLSSANIPSYKIDKHLVISVENHTPVWVSLMLILESNHVKKNPLHATEHFHSVFHQLNG